MGQTEGGVSMGQVGVWRFVVGWGLRFVRGGCLRGGCLVWGAEFEECVGGEGWKVEGAGVMVDGFGSSGGRWGWRGNWGW